MCIVQYVIHNTVVLDIFVVVCLQCPCSLQDILVYQAIYL